MGTLGNVGGDVWPRRFGWATVAGVELGLIGPFGSYPANLFTRLGYWIGLCWLGVAILWPALAGAIARARLRGTPVRFSVGVAMLVACVPVAALAAAGCGMLWPVHASGMRALEWYGATLAVAGPLSAGLLWLERGQAMPAQGLAACATEEAAATSALPLPAHQLPFALCLQMEDHHVRLHLPAGSVLHLASLREAMRQAGPERGLQVHRSWWVARDAVTGWEETGRSVSLLLGNGMRVPVARNRLALLREEGWLAALPS